MKRILRRMARKILGISFTDTTIVNRLDGVVFMDGPLVKRIVDFREIGPSDGITQKMEITLVNLGSVYAEGAE